jgi:hypothetical protein
MTSPQIKKVTVKPHGARPAALKGPKSLADLLGDVSPFPSPSEKKKGIVARCIGVIYQDIKERFNGAKALVGESPNGWEDYRQFCDLARGKGKN